jgi:hypothetical protein
MKAFLKKMYLFVESLPDRLYPFTCEIEGKIVRGRASYHKAVDRAMEKYGPNNLGYSLIFYRGIFHVTGAILFISAAGLISRELFGSEVALYVLMVAAAGSLFAQEFYWHPRRFHQMRHKSYIDWFGWVIPMVAYVMFF